MALLRLDHVNVKTSALQAMVEWYERILGLRSGVRPEFGFPGAWLYCGDHPVLHLVEVASEPVSNEPKIEHFAFQADGFEAFCAHLKSHGIEGRVVKVPGFDIVQVNVFDVDGNHIHVDFKASEAGITDD